MKNKKRIYETIERFNLEKKKEESYHSGELFIEISGEQEEYLNFLRELQKTGTLCYNPTLSVEEFKQGKTEKTTLEKEVEFDDLVLTDFRFIFTFNEDFFSYDLYLKDGLKLSKEQLK